MNKVFIENEARALQLALYRNWRRFWPEKPTPRQVLRPEYAVELLGITIEYAPEIKSLAMASERFDIAGVIDRQSNRISISLKFKDESARFTIAHELGHWILHKESVVLHRDRPIDIGGWFGERTAVEKEADYFAGFFLMPRTLVTAAFATAFGVKAPLVITEAVAFRLRPDNPEAFLEESLLSQAAAIASIENYNGVRFNSLAKYFFVSSGAMARQLVELGLVESD